MKITENNRAVQIVAQSFTSQLPMDNGDDIPATLRKEAIRLAGRLAGDTRRLARIMEALETVATK